MCAREPGREWSGVLFYSSTGVFGEDNFQIVAEEFYLMDIGSSTFTGYDYEPEFISLLMNNPRLLKLKKGHIHSHNTMNVFFSGTDTDEIRDNSEFHNYYFSLIVNNKNEMTAKVAFRGKQTIKSATSYSYKGDNGNEKTGFYETTTENDVCYVYNCIIDNSFHNDLMKKYQDIKSKVTTPVLSESNTVTGTYGTDTELPFPNTKKVSKYSTKDFSWENDEAIDVWGDDAKHADFKQPTVKDALCLSFISKVMVGDILNEEDPLQVIKRFSTMGKNALNQAQGRIEKRIMSFYMDCFPDDIHLSIFEDVMANCQELVQMCERKYESVTDMLWEVFNVEIK